MASPNVPPGRGSDVTYPDWSPLQRKRQHAAAHVPPQRQNRQRAILVAHEPDFDDTSRIRDAIQIAGGSAAERRKPGLGLSASVPVGSRGVTARERRSEQDHGSDENNGPPDTASENQPREQQSVTFSFAAYGVSCRARAERVALRRMTRRFAPWSRLAPLGFPAPARRWRLRDSAMWMACPRRWQTRAIVSDLSERVDHDGNGAILAALIVVDHQTRRRVTARRQHQDADSTSAGPLGRGLRWSGSVA